MLGEAGKQEILQQIGSENSRSQIVSWTDIFGKFALAWLSAPEQCITIYYKR